MKDAPTRPTARRRLRTGLLVAGAAVAVAASAVLLTNPASAATQYCSNSTGGSNGSYYQMWTAGQGSACISLNSATSYTSQWSGIGDFVAGVGWKPGSTSRVINYTGSLNANGGTNLLSLYGWSTNPLVEYYVIDGYVGSPNYSGQNMGTMTSDGGTYTIIKHQQVNQPCITGNSCTFWQYLAIRNSPRTSGTITFSNFVNAWASHGMNLGSRNYEIMATEAWGGGSGNSSVTLNSGGGSGGGGGGGCTATLSAGQQWSDRYNLNVSVSGSSTWTVTVNVPSPEKVLATWNVNASYPSAQQLVAKSNGSGNNWGATIQTNGTWTWPTVSCSPS